jgi:hypothetical protein
MSNNVNLDMLLHPVVICVNVGVNVLTKMHYSKFKNWTSTAKFHYNIKVTLFNLSTALLACRVGMFVTGKGSLHGALIDSALLLFFRRALEKSLSTIENSKNIMKGVLNKIINTSDNIDGVSIFDNTYANYCLALIANNHKDMLIIRGFSILKKWA